MLIFVHPISHDEFIGTEKTIIVWPNAHFPLGSFIQESHDMD